MKFDPILAKKIKKIREYSLEKRSHSRKVVSWVEDHRAHTKATKAIVFILPTKGCSWALSNSGGCSICGYLYDNPQEPDFEKLLSSFSESLQKNISEEIGSIKLFTSGSALDQKELPLNILLSMLESLKSYSHVEEIVLESRPEFIREEILEKIREVINLNRIEIAVGLESGNDTILKQSINKGFLWADFEKSAKLAMSFGVRIKAYLLFKPPFISEYDSFEDVLLSVKKLVELNIDTISLNAVSIHRGTFLEELFDDNKYRPPWLWSLVSLCKEIKRTYPALRLICEPVAGGKERGAHNCGKCDKDIVQRLKDFTLTQDISNLELLYCPCQTEYTAFLVTEKISMQ